ncbi:helix-turn-helix transcriptional regulator, partial [Streptomyces sp. NPDC000151]|uniref:helix-turn-helix domain-containing protein n=1 Tax=Streptomyces sp. NPDC000151 TaxID=3154244 RepID=UPI00332AB6DF
MDQLSFGRRLRALRRQQALSQAELGGGELSASYISLLESGKRPPTDEVLLKLAARLGITADELVGDTGIARPQAPLDAALEASYALSRARLALLTGDAAAALDRFTDVGGDGSAAPALFADALLGRAAALERLDRPAEAATLRRQWLDTFGDRDEDHVLHTEVLTGLLRCLRETGELRAAAAQAEDALRGAEDAGLTGTPMGLELAGLVAEFRWDLGQDGAAAELLDRATATAAALDGRQEWALAYDAAAEAARAAGRARHAAALAERAVDACRDGGAGLPVARLRTAAAAVLGGRSGSQESGPHTSGQDSGLAAAREVLAEWGTPVDVAYGEVALAGRLLAAGDAAGA